MTQRVSLGILLSLVILVWLCASAPSAGLKPRIAIDRNTFDFGPLAEGAKVEHIFKITNEGTAVLRIGKLRANCECTTASVKKSKLNPGESTELKVVMDTTMKIRDTEKTIMIWSNDLERRTISLTVTAFIDPHKGLTPSQGIKIFSGKCATCHVMQGKGLTGDDLFFADCVMCHQFKPKPGHVIGGPLAPRDYDAPSVAAHVKRATCYGTSHAMPGFLDKAGGPLTETQIDSIIEFLKNYSKEHNSGRLTPSSN